MGQFQPQFRALAMVIVDMNLIVLTFNGIGINSAIANLGYVLPCS